MKLSVKKIDGRIYFLFRGELDDKAAKGVRELMDEILDRETYSSVVLDLSQLTFMDSTGIGLIIGRYKRLKPYKKDIFIMNPSRQVDKILVTTGLYQIIRKIG